MKALHVSAAILSSWRLTPEKEVPIISSDLNGYWQHSSNARFRFEPLLGHRLQREFPHVVCRLQQGQRVDCGGGMRRVPTRTG